MIPTVPAMEDTMGDCSKCSPITSIYVPVDDGLPPEAWLITRVPDKHGRYGPNTFVDRREKGVRLLEVENYMRVQSSG